MQVVPDEAWRCRGDYLAHIGPSAGCVDPRYLHYGCGLQSRFIASRSIVDPRESTEPASLTLGADPHEFAVPVPDLEEQRRIADFLDDQVARIDQAIAASAPTTKSFADGAPAAARSTGAPGLRRFSGLRRPGTSAAMICGGYRRERARSDYTDVTTACRTTRSVDCRHPRGWSDAWRLSASRLETDDRLHHSSASSYAGDALVVRRRYVGQSAVVTDVWSEALLRLSIATV